jgi:hypothetical protein
MKIILMIIVCGLSMTGCARYHWEHPTKSSSDYEADWYDCEVIATQLVNNQGFGGNFLMVGQETGRCMRIKKGWVSKRDN